MKEDNKLDWEVIDKQKVVDNFIDGGLLGNTTVFYKYEYIMRNRNTGEIKRV